MIFLSIIIPHYNLQASLLERCIKSIIEQKMPKESYEIIIIDDNSEQPPLWVEEKFSEAQITLIQTPHGGPGAARNAGIEKATGKYIYFVDADDALIPNSITPCLEILHTEQPQILRIKHITSRNDEIASTRNTPELKTSNIISGAQYMIIEHLSGAPWSYIFERTLAIKHNIRFEPGVYHEDEEFNTKLHYYATSLIDTNATVYNYIIRPESITANSNREFEDKRIEDFLSLIERLAKFRTEHHSSSNNIQRRGFDHKLTMLAVDAILNLMYDGRSAQEIHNVCTTRLQPLNLYPLPRAPYILKYKIFRLLANHKNGLRILRLFLPRHKPEKK